MSTLGPWLGGRRPFDPFTSDIWDPFDFGGNTSWDISPLRRRGGERDDTTTLAQTYVDWRETENAHIFRADLPGVRKEEVKVQVEDNNILSISGERTREEEDQGDTWHRLERRRGSFVRRFRLPENANMDDVQCALDHGVLNVIVPKKQITLPSRNIRSIDIR